MRNVLLGIMCALILGLAQPVLAQSAEFQQLKAEAKEWYEKSAAQRLDRRLFWFSVRKKPVSLYGMTGQIDHRKRVKPINASLIDG